MAKGGLAAELWAYMRVRKKWWLAPILLVLLLVGALLVFAQGSALSPFIYTIFQGAALPAEEECHPHGITVTSHSPSPG